MYYMAKGFTDQETEYPVKKGSYYDMDTSPDHKSQLDRVPTTLGFTTRPVDIRRMQTSVMNPTATLATQADAWEKEENESVRDRYEKMRDVIQGWETKKKQKAKQKLDKIEADLDRKRAKAVQSYHKKIEQIEAVAGGGRAQAEENCRNDEFKAKQKANKIRLTGKLPTETSLCY